MQEIAGTRELPTQGLTGVDLSFARNMGLLEKTHFLDRKP